MSRKAQVTGPKERVEIALAMTADDRQKAVDKVSALHNEILILSAVAQKEEADSAVEHKAFGKATSMLTEADLQDGRATVGNKFELAPGYSKADLFAALRKNRNVRSAAAKAVTLAEIRRCLK